MRFGIPADLNVTVVNPIINPMRVNVKGFGDQARAFRKSREESCSMQTNEKLKSPWGSY